MASSESLPSDLTAARAMILAERAARLAAEAEAANAKADLLARGTNCARARHLLFARLGRY
jgi:hypothetical protein